MKSGFVSICLLFLLGLGLFASLMPQASATTFLNDGFESGNFSMWSGTANNPGDAIRVISTQPHHGTYHAEADLAGDGSGAAYSYQTIAGQSILYARAYFTFKTAQPLNDQRITVIRFAGTTWISSIAFRRDASGVLGLELASKQGAATEYTWYAYPWTLNTPYSVKLYVLIHGTAGAYTVWLDNNQVIALTGKDSNDAGNVTDVRVGVTSGILTNAHEVYFDCAVVADTDIPLESIPIITLGLHVGTNTTVHGTPSKFYADWTTANSNLSKYVFGTNNTGSWVNETATSFPSGQTYGWSNITKTLNSTIGRRVEWQIWANNTSGNWTSTTLKYLITTSTEPPSHLVWSTGFENIVKTSPNNLNLTVDNYAVLNGAGSAIFMEGYDKTTPGMTSHSGTRSLGGEVTSTITESHRSQLDMYITRLAAITDEWYVSVWTFLPSDLSFNVPLINWNWLSIANPYQNMPTFYPQIELAIVKPNITQAIYKITVQFRWSGGYLDNWKVYNNFPLKLGEWFKIEWHVKADSSSVVGGNGQLVPNGDSLLQVWVDGIQIANVQGAGFPTPLPKSGITGYLGNSQPTENYITINKIYYHGEEHVPKRIWSDDMELWNAMPTGDVSPPTYSNVAHDTTIAGQVSTFSAKWQDNAALSGSKFSWNGTGSWSNNTWVTLSGNPAWATSTKTLPSVGVKVGYRWYANDTSNNWASTSIFTLTTTSIGGSIAVLLNTPSNEASERTKSITFTYQPTFYQIVVNSSLWLGFAGGTWQVATWNSTDVLNATTNFITHTFTISRIYTWNIAVYNSTTRIFAQQNRTLTIILEPYYDIITYEGRIAGDTTTLSAHWLDTDGLSGYIFGWNPTGTWSNDTWVSLSGTSAWANATKTLPEIFAQTVYFKWYVKDTDNKWSEAQGDLSVTLRFSYVLESYNLNLKSVGSPYLYYSTRDITALSYSESKLTFTVSASSGNVSTTKVYVGDNGKPLEINPANANGGYDEATKIQTIIWLHSSEQPIEVIWAFLIPPPDLFIDPLASLWQFLSEGDLLGLLQAIYVSVFTSADVLYGLVVMLCMGAIYIRTRSLILISILWLLVGGILIVAMPLVAGLGIVLMIFGVAGLLYQMFKPHSSSY